MNISILIPPIVGSVIGYTTNWLAIKMLFKPHKAYHIGKIRIPFTPGLIPRERDRIAKSLGEAVGKNLLTEEVILKELTHPKVIQTLKEFISQEVLKEEIDLEKIVQGIFGDEDVFLDKISVNFVKNLEMIVSTDPTISLFIKEKMTSAVQYESNISSIVSEPISNAINNYLTEHKVDIANYICVQMTENAVADKIKNIISVVVKEKIGGLAAMFIQPDSLYTMIVDFTRSYLEVEEHQDELVGAFVKIKDQLREKNIQDFLKQSSYDQFVEGGTSWISNKLIQLIKEDNFNILLKNMLRQLLLQKIQLTDELKEKIEEVIEHNYKTFACNHLPVFLEQFNVSGVVENQINQFSVAQVEDLIFKIVDKELNAITWFGALLGFAMGTIQIFF